MRRGIQTSAAFGAVVSILIVASIASVGYFQFYLAPTVFATPSSSSSSSSACPPGGCVNVTIPSGAYSGPSAAPGFSPDTVTVVIGVNNTVVWVNNDLATHTATSVDHSWDTGDIAAGASSSLTFNTPGTYKYACIYHYWMTGTVIVKAGTSAPSSTAATST